MSTATRELVERGSVREVAVPGSRRRWFRAEDDVWASALAAQRPQLSRVVAFADEVAAVLGPEESGPRKQLENMRDHHVWLQQFHQRMYDEWTEHQRRRA